MGSEDLIKPAGDHPFAQWRGHRAPKPPSLRVADAARPTDRAQCRILLNEAQREVDRLRRGLARPVETQVRVDRAFEAIHPDPSIDPRPRLYAPAPIGEVDLPPREAARATDGHVRPLVIDKGFHITNLGTLLDVLA